MLGEIMQYLHNYFDRERLGGTFTIAGGELVLPSVADGAYIRILGSQYNDQVMVKGAEELADETFTGAVWVLCPPKEFLALAAEITAWQETNKAAAASPYQSESFGGYSYTKSAGTADGWQGVFRSRLRAWRKVNAG